MFIDDTDGNQSLEPGEDEEDVDVEVRFQTTSSDENRPLPSPPVGTGTGAIVHELLIKPGKYAAGAVMNEVRALGTDVQSDNRTSMIYGVIHEMATSPKWICLPKPLQHYLIP
jgi:hypothetical protein